MPRMLAQLKPADARRVPPEHLPRIPSWWPLQPADAAPMTDEQRAARRHARAVREACAGPFDEQRLAVELDEQGRPPRQFVPLERRDVRYVLDERESTRNRAVYRYDTSCELHSSSMRAVEAAFDEVGPQYTHASREDDPR